jgi:hypothetical protein
MKMNRMFVILLAISALAYGAPRPPSLDDKVEKPRHEKAARRPPIAAVAYAAETEVLTVTFSNGDRYEYAAVPKATADGLAAAEHKGHFFNAEVKGKFTAKKISSSAGK